MATQTYIYPDIEPSKAGHSILFNTSMSISPSSGIESITENAGERWVTTLTYNILRRNEALEIKGHLLKLRGNVNKTLIKDFGFTQRGAWQGSPQVDGGNQYGLLLKVKNLSPNLLFAKTGDRFKLGARVHEVTQDASSDSSGKATLYLANELIDLTVNNDPILTGANQLTTLFRWQDPSQINQFNGNKSYYKSVTLTFIEALA